MRVTPATSLPSPKDRHIFPARDDRRVARKAEKTRLRYQTPSASAAWSLITIYIIRSKTP
jgi:hypothetical protein